MDSQTLGATADDWPHLCDCEAKTAIQFLELLRQEVRRLNRCDENLLEELQAIREAVEAVADRHVKNPRFGYAVPWKQPRVKCRSSLYREQEGMQRIYQVKDFSSKSGRRRAKQQCKGIVAAPTSSRVDVEQRSQQGPHFASIDGVSLSSMPPSTAPWFDLVRPVPDVSLQELCGDSFDLANAFGYQTDLPFDQDDHSIVGKGPSSPSSVQRIPPCAPTSGFSRCAPIHSTASGNAHSGQPRRPATSLGFCPRDTPSPCTNTDERHPALAGELHIEVFVEAHPRTGGASEVHLELEVCCAEPQRPTASLHESPPLPSFRRIAVASSGGSCGSVILQVLDAERSQLRVALNRSGSNEVTLVALARLINEAPVVRSALQDLPWVPLQWALMEFTVHLRTAFVGKGASRHIESVPAHLPPAARTQATTRPSPWRAQPQNLGARFISEGKDSNEERHQTPRRTQETSGSHRQRPQKEQKVIPSVAISP